MVGGELTSTANQCGTTFQGRHRDRYLQTCPNRGPARVNEGQARASKAHGYMVEPRPTGPTAFWEGHHATNPCSVRLTADPRVFLGYRAGGLDDYFAVDIHDVWASHLGLAILDARGEHVDHRLPLPVMTIERDAELPQDRAAYEQWIVGPHASRVLVLHDFRFWEDGGYLYVIYHEGTVTQVFDCIVRMPVPDFLSRVARSLELATEPIEAIRDEWRRLWWQPGVWEPAGVGGSNRIYPSWANKNDIVFIRLLDGSLRMLHRPCPDVSIVDTAGQTYCPAGPDGIAQFGTVQTSIRPGYLDNSHIGNNGTPIPARIGETPVYLDVVHGVHNRTLTQPDGEGWRLLYLPYLRLLDAATGECLYWSDGPLLDADDTWREYVEEGEWVRNLAHLEGVMFAGGQVEVEAGRNGVDDLFTFYTGVGDTAVARATFRLRDVVPGQVLADIEVRAAHGRHRPGATPAVTVDLHGDACGWQWRLKGGGLDKRLGICRTLEGDHGVESTRRAVAGRPGRFDADGLYLEPQAVVEVVDLGFLVAYRGVRWEGEADTRRTVSGMGLMVLDRENPERILYRSAAPLPGSVADQPGWTCGWSPLSAGETLEGADAAIPTSVREEIGRLYKRHPMATDMARWLRIKKGLEPMPEYPGRMDP